MDRQRLIEAQTWVRDEPARSANFWLEHGMKLWRPHNEILISSLMLYRDTGDEKYLKWFYKTADYCKAHFSDPEYGEWYGYLRRDGLPTMLFTKGSIFKAPSICPGV